MTEVDAATAAYLAGVVDSDGTIGIRRTTYAQRRGHGVSVTYFGRMIVKQVAPQAVELLHSVFGGHRSSYKPPHANRRALHVWEVHHARAAHAAERMLPHLRIKVEQAKLVLEIHRLNQEPKGFDVPAIVDGEPMVTMAEAARLLDKSYAVVIQAVRQGSIPHIREGRRHVRIPRSYLDVWQTRARVPARSEAVTREMDGCYWRCRELNRVGVDSTPETEGGWGA